MSNLMSPPLIVYDIILPPMSVIYEWIYLLWLSLATGGAAGETRIGYPWYPKIHESLRAETGRNKSIYLL